MIDVEEIREDEEGGERESSGHHKNGDSHDAGSMAGLEEHELISNEIDQILMNE